LPYIFSAPEEADKLVWNNRCVPNLSGYLLENQIFKSNSSESNTTDSSNSDKQKTAIIAKPCDARAIVSLVQENQIKRDDVYIIGMTCNGMADVNGNLLPACADCTVRTPPLYDTLIGDECDKGTVLLSRQFAQNSSDNDGTGEPVPRLIDEMSKCILCFSCRQSCYGCYCKTCFMERGVPDWQTVSPDLGAKMLYHLGRTMHLSGRCVECGACENACASGVNIRYLIREVTKFIEDTYDYKAGMDLETEPAMLRYDTNDPEIGFLGFESDNSGCCGGGDENVE